MGICGSCSHSMKSIDKTRQNNHFCNNGHPLEWQGDKFIYNGKMNAINVENTQIYIIQFVGNAQNVIYIFVLFAMILLFPDLVQYIIF